MPVAQTIYSSTYLRYALGLLTTVYVVNFVDRQVLSILMQSIKQDLGLSDLQLGLLSGTAFGIFYATLGIPIARIADRVSRKGVIAVSLTIWSAMTALCGSASSFFSLLAFRVGVGIGEAGGSPPAHSMISDLFPESQRATAMGIFSLGVPLGIMIGFMAGGFMNDILGWRMAFLIVGLPGIVLAGIVALTLREPPRGLADATIETSDHPSPTTAEVLRFLWSSPSFRHNAWGSGLYAFVGYSITTWAPPFLERSHGMATSQVGTALALIIGLGGGVGIFLGGALTDRMGNRDPRLRMRIPAYAMWLSVPFGFVIYTTDQTALTLILLVVPTFLGLMYQAPSLALAQSLATPKMRATASAILLFMINIIGLAIGPAATGFLSDLLTPYYGENALRYAMLLTSLVLVASGYQFWRASQTITQDLHRAEAASRREADGLALDA